MPDIRSPAPSRCVALTRRTIDRSSAPRSRVPRRPRRQRRRSSSRSPSIPVFGAVGAAVDYSRANAARTAMQAALDATALMVAKEALNLNGAGAEQGEDLFQRAVQSSRREEPRTSRSRCMTNGPGDFTVIGRSDRQDRHRDRAGHRQENDRPAHHQPGALGLQGARAALALDNTGSMASKNKMVELKAAVKLLFAILKKNSKVPGDTKIASFRSAPWSTSAPNTSDAPWIGYDGTITKANWSGCVADRDQPNDVKDTAPSGARDPVSRCRMRLAGEGLAADRRLGRARRHGRHHDAARHDQRDHRHGVGLARADARASRSRRARRCKPDVDKVMILLTDGLNTAEPLHHQCHRRSTRAPRRSATTSRRRRSSCSRCG